jgi:hypothetical protein
VSDEQQTVYARIIKARESMKLKPSGNMKIKTTNITYSTIDDLCAVLVKELSKQDLWLNVTLEDNAVHVNVIDGHTDLKTELFAYPCVLGGRDTKLDAGHFTSCKRYALTTAFNLAAGDEAAMERSEEQTQTREKLGYMPQQRNRQIPPMQLTEIRARLVASGFLNPQQQQEKISGIIGQPIQHMNELTSQAQVDRILEELPPVPVAPAEPTQQQPVFQGALQ